jgi:hypothetical protein
MIDSIIFIIALGIALLLWALKQKISTKFEEFAVISEKATEDIPLNLWKTDKSRLLSLYPSSDDYYAKFDLKHLAISQLPTQIYANESAMIVLHPVLESWENNESLLVVNLKTQLDTKKVVDLLKADDFQTKLKNYALLELTQKKIGKRSSKKHKYLAMELLASGFEIAGSTKQKQELDTPVLTYTWNISTENSGVHEVAIALTLEDETGEKSISIGTIIHKIKVVSLGPLTHRQVNIFLAISGVITTVLTLLQALRLLGVI